MARQADGSTDTLESDFEQVCQLAAPQVTQFMVQKVGQQAKAINCASYIQNRVPHKQLDGITPFKSWSGHKLDVTHFRIFGSTAWARIPTEKMKAH